jgi:hypothetical protein
MKYQYWNTFYFDVMPGTLDEFLDWDAITARDSDMDGIIDGEETLTHSWDWDSDGDHLGDGYELLIGTDPTKDDTDNDGIDDRTEIRIGTNATVRDSDGDGLEDLMEYRGWVISFNFSGERFHWHIASNPRMNDTDGDGLCDMDEYEDVLNPMSKDTDGNGVWDVKDYRDHDLYYAFTSDRAPGDAGGSPIVDIEIDEAGYVYALIGLGTWYEIHKFRLDGEHLGRWNTIGAYVLDIEVDNIGDVYLIENIDGGSYLYRYNSSGTYLDEIPIQSDAGRLAIDDQNGYIYAATGETGKIYKNYKSNGTPIMEWIPDGLSWPKYGGMEVDSNGDLFVTCTSHDCILKYNETGVELGRATSSRYGDYVDPVDICLDPDGFMYVVEKGNNRIHKLDEYGENIVSFGSYGTGNNHFDSPLTIAFHEDLIYVGDGGNKRIQVLVNDVQYAPPNETFNYTDTDGDGLTDTQENTGWEISFTNLTGTFVLNVTSDPNLVDTDGDGLTDQQEYNIGSNPRSGDTDGDGESDLDESGGGTRDGTIPSRRSSVNTNPNHWDTDGDELGDNVEITYNSDPTQTDTDGEGLTDLEEFIIMGDPRSSDTDNDGLNDLLEEEFGSGILIPDGDGDGILDGAEMDLGTNPLMNDTDRDGLTETLEIMFGIDPLNHDTDNDGLPDGFELENHLNASSNDTDGDSVPDSEEIEKGLNPLNGDSDGDGVPDNLDRDYEIVLDREVLCVIDDGNVSSEFLSGLSRSLNLVNSSGDDFDDSRGNYQYIVLVGDPEDENGTAGSTMKDLLMNTPEIYEEFIEEGGNNIAVRYGEWTPIQTVVMVKDPGEYDDEKIVSILKSMKMTVRDNWVSAYYENPRACFQLDHPEAVWSTNSVSSGKFTKMLDFTVNVSSISNDLLSVPLDEESGLEEGDVQFGRVVDFMLTDNFVNESFDDLAIAQFKIYYTVDDLMINEINESTISLYWLDEEKGEWFKVSDEMDWVNATELNTTNQVLHGKEYEGYFWADVTHLSMFGLAGMSLIPSPPIAIGGENFLHFFTGEIVTLDGSLSTSGVEIMNYTWTIEELGVVLYGMVTSYVFDEERWYNITLTVRDALSREASQRFIVYVRDPPPTTFILHVGPLYNEDNMIISGAEITLNFNGDIYQNSTNESGIATFNLSMIYARADVNVTIEAEGYEIQTFDTYVKTGGSLGIPLPKMKLIEKDEPEKEKDFPTFIVILLIIFILLILIAVTIYIIKRKQKAEGLEE